MRKRINLGDRDSVMESIVEFILSYARLHAVFSQGETAEGFRRSMEQPRRYIQDGFPRHVSSLEKAINLLLKNDEEEAALELLALYVDSAPGKFTEGALNFAFAPKMIFRFFEPEIASPFRDRFSEIVTEKLLVTHYLTYARMEKARKFLKELLFEINRAGQFGDQEWLMTKRAIRVISHHRDVTFLNPLREMVQLVEMGRLAPGPEFSDTTSYPKYLKEVYVEIKKLTK